MVLTAPDSELVTVTFTLGTDAPEASVTVPTMVACCPAALHEKPRTRARTGSVNRRMFHLPAGICGKAPFSLERIESDLSFIFFSPVNRFGRRLSPWSSYQGAFPNQRRAIPTSAVSAMPLPAADVFALRSPQATGCRTAKLRVDGDGMFTQA